MAEMRVERIGLDGDGRVGGVRVPGGLPREVWEGDVADGALVEARLVAASADRVQAPCPHYAECGGCSLQHFADIALAEWKREVVAQALEIRGISADVRATVTSPPGSRRRAVLAGRRTRKTVRTGFHGRRSDVVVDIAECLVLRPEIVAAKPALGELTRMGASRSGAVRIAVTHGPEGLDVAVEEAKPLDGGLAVELAEIAEHADFARLSWNGEPVAQRRVPYQVLVGGVRVVPPPGGFLQATVEGEKTLVACAEKALGDVARVADLFCGIGTFALPLAQRAQVLAVEGSQEMVAALDAGWRRAEGVKQVAARARDLFRRPVLSQEFKGFDGVVIDPPRAGAEAQMRELAASGVPRIAAISCNPVTFARDARILLDGGYRLDWVQPIDQFLWSSHVELAARFSR